ncbi:hypothetical protein RvY_05472 [Ramazzottius varieornatus]|uniref:Uncharacterized protein n=1 Tax=Ramazzottius varieornatus TaxID=947166 RepID=A0A1D1UV40_RAMVA|nr:hypothetical protein RvY_05472 [Ramazzottius varieornatus]
MSRECSRPTAEHKPTFALLASLYAMSARASLERADPLLDTSVALSVSKNIRSLNREGGRKHAQLSRSLARL